MNKRSCSRALIATFAAVPLAVSLSGSGVAGAAGTSFLPPSLKGPAPATVKIASNNSFSLNNLPTWLAFGLGYFGQVSKRFHTVVSYDPYSSGIQEASFLGGVDQFVEGGAGFFEPAVLAGKDQLEVFQSSISLATAMTALAKYKPIYGSKVSKFTGTWCQETTAGTLHAAVVLAAALARVNPSLTNIGSPAAVLSTLQSGACQLTGADGVSAVNGALSGTTYVVENLLAPSLTIGLVGEYGVYPMGTSHAFAAKYPKLTQAMVDAELKGLLYLQANIKNIGRLYAHLPAAMQDSISLGSFTQFMSYIAQGFTPAFDSGEFTKRSINDTLWLQESTRVIPVGTAVNPSQMYTNKYVIQGYKDLGAKPPTGPIAGVVKIPTTLGKPTAEAATAFALLTGAGLPANTGIDPLLKIKG